VDCVEEVEPSAERREVEPPEEEPEQGSTEVEGASYGAQAQGSVELGVFAMQWTLYYSIAV
jgi:hypothetical protein